MDPSDFELVAVLGEHYPTFRRECELIGRELYVPWPIRGSYQGEWLVFPFFMCSHPDDIGCDFEANRRRCPETVAILRRHPLIRSAGYSRMEPGCHILPHTDSPTAHVVRMHLGLVTGEGALMRMDGETFTLQEGRSIVFDGLSEHEAANLGSTPRIVLLVDFEMSESERAVVAARGR